MLCYCLSILIYSTSTLYVTVTANSVAVKQCFNNGILLADGTCKCKSYYSGTKCQTPYCKYGVVVNTTTDTNTMEYKEICQCEEGWKGQFCHIIKCKYGKPDKTNQGCICRNFHYEGFHCNKIKEGECLKGRRSYKTFRCICEPGWEGEFCHRIICDNKMRRMSNTECECIHGFLPPHCHRPDGWDATDWYMIGIYGISALFIATTMYIIITRGILMLCKKRPTSN